MKDGALTKRLWSLSYPSMLCAAMESFYDMTDMMWIGRISETAVSAVTLFAALSKVFLVFNAVIGGASIAMLSQAFGKKEDKRVNRIAEQTISFKILIAIIASLIFFLILKPTLKFYTDDPDIIKSAVDYGFLRIVFMFVNFALYSVNTIFRCTNNSKIPMRIMFISTVVNIFLDPLLIFEKIPFVGIRGLGLGVFGAAAATVISAAIGLLIGMGLLLRENGAVKITLKGLFSLEPNIDRDLIRIGIPAGLEMVSRNVSYALLIKFVSVYGTSAISAAGIGGKLFGFFLMPLGGFAMGGAAIAGQLLGEEDIEGTKNVAKVTAGICALIMTFLAIFTVLFSEELMRLFIDEKTVIAIGANMLRLTAVSYVIEGLAFGKRVVFSGSGETAPLFISGFLSRWVGQLGICALAVKFKLGLNFIWLSYIAASVVNFAVTEYYYRKGKWEEKRV